MIIKDTEDERFTPEEMTLVEEHIKAALGPGAKVYQKSESIGVYDETARYGIRHQECSVLKISIGDNKRLPGNPVFYVAKKAAGYCLEMDDSNTSDKRKYASWGPTTPLCLDGFINDLRRLNICRGGIEGTLEACKEQSGNISVRNVFSTVMDASINALKGVQNSKIAQPASMMVSMYAGIAIANNIAPSSELAVVFLALTSAAAAPIALHVVGNKIRQLGAEVSSAVRKNDLDIV